MHIVTATIILLELTFHQTIITCGVIDKHGELDHQSATVEVKGNLLHHDHLHLIVNTTSSKHNISLTRVQDDVMPDNVQSFIVHDNTRGKTEIHTDKLPNDVVKYKRQFFHNLDTGSIVSIIPSSTGHIHVEGFLFHGVLIAPPGSAERHKRDLHQTKHTVWQEDDSERYVDYLEVPEEFSNENLVEKRKKHSVHKRFSGRGNRRGNTRWNSRRDIDRSHDHSRKGREDREDENEKDTEEPLDYLEVPAYFRDSFSFKTRATHRILKRQVKNREFIIEVFLLVDYKVFEWFNKDIAKLGTYLLHFWQAVNYKFRTMKDPNVSVKVKQYGAVRSTKFQSFIEENRMKNDTSLISLKEVLGGFREWMIKFETNMYFSSHDVAVLMTGEDLCRRNTSSNGCFKLTAGIGYVKGACISSRKYAKSTYDVAVSEIGKSFKGVLVSAHEVGHLIGAYHDGVDEAADCPKDSGFIMSYTRHNASMFSRFSECSKRSIRHFLSQIWYSKCLRETSEAGYTYPELLPGQYMPILDQCVEYSNGFPCPSQPVKERCEKLCCENSVYRIFRREPAVDGTECGFKKMCMNGACISSPTPKL